MARAAPLVALPDEHEDRWSTAASFDLTPSKLRPPVPRAGLVPRAALLERLLGAGDAPVVLVVAPPGYGKTTLLAQWAERKGPRVAWLSADAGDNDPAALLVYLAAALDRIDTVDPMLYRVLGARGHGVLAARRLAAAMAAMAPVSIAVDHVESITAPASLDILAELALRLPGGCQLALASRDELPIPTGRLRAGGGIAEVGADDLAMGPDEAPELLAATGIDLTPAEMASLVERTEGWPVGIYLAALAIQAGSHQREVGITFTGDDRFMADYLRAELLDRVSDEEAVFLTRTSVLDTMSGPLCDAVLETSGSATVLENLEARNLLVVPLDRQRRWYRYHHLFRELLAAELSRREPDGIDRLHRNAAGWCLANGQAEAALVHAQSAGDGDEVARLILELVQPVWASGRCNTVLRWMEWVEEHHLIERYPAVAVHGSLIFALLGRAGMAERWAATAEAAAETDGARATVPDGGSTMEGLRRYLMALLCRGGVAQMRDDARVAWDELGPASPYRSTMVFTEGLSFVLDGDPERADAILARAYEASNALGATPLTAVILAERGMLAEGRHDWEEADAIARRALELIVDGRFDDYWTSALVYAWGARVALHAGRIEDAKDRLSRAMRLRPLLTYALPVVSLQALLELARAYVSLADPSGARAVLRQAADIVQQRPDLGVLPAQAKALGRQVETMRVDVIGASSLTAAELRLVPLLPTHLSFREIGERLFISRHTVKTQAISIYRKLGVSSRHEAIERMEALGLYGSP